MQFKKVIYQDDEIRFGLAGEFAKPLLDYPIACGILPLEKVNGQWYLHLVSQFRMGAQQNSIEIPAGKKLADESELACAQRELAEEARLSATEYNRLYEYYPAIGISTEKLVIYEALGLQPDTSHAADDDEEIEILHWPVTRLKEAISNKEILDSKTILALHFSESFGVLG